MIIEVACSKGTYIRSLAEDISKKLGCGATISALRRLRVGELKIGMTKTLSDLQDINNDEMLRWILIPAYKILSH